MTFKNGKPVERFYTGRIREARKEIEGFLRSGKLPKCFAHYRDEGQCLLQDNHCCRICREATFIWLRELQDARIEERLRLLKEWLKLSESQVKELKGDGYGKD